MMDYVRWLFGLEFCTPRYVITRELAMDKLRVGWGIRARRYEEKVKKRRCWRNSKTMLERERRIWVNG